MFKKISPNKWILTLIIAWCGACVFAQDKDSISAKITEIEYTLSQLQQQKNEALLVIEKEKAKAVKEVDELTEKKQVNGTTIRQFSIGIELYKATPVRLEL